MLTVQYFGEVSVPLLSPSLCSHLTFCKVLWSVDFNFKHSIYFDCGYLLWSVKSFLFFFVCLFNAFIRFPLKKPLGLGFPHWWCLRLTPSSKKKTFLWQGLSPYRLYDYAADLWTQQRLVCTTRLYHPLLWLPSLASELQCALGPNVAFFTWTLKSLEFKDSCLQRSLLVSQATCQKKTCILNTLWSSG